jgi:antitoxin component YwqK of YwqJK toxin-antitoxin module
MNKLVFFLLFNCIFAFAQDTINQLDSKGLKNGYWRGFYEGTKNLRFEGQFKNGIEVGTFKFYDNTKKKNIISTRKFETNNVAHTIIYNGNFKVSEGKTINKKREGKYLTYHYMQTEVMTEEFYKNDLLHGLRKVFYKSGEIAEECMYENGKRHGFYKKYAENGKIMEESYYQNGQYQGKAIFRDALGNITSEGNYDKGKSVGIWKIYENGKLKTTENRSKKVKSGKVNQIKKSNDSIVKNRVSKSMEK